MLIGAPLAALVARQHIVSASAWGHGVTQVTDVVECGLFDSGNQATLLCRTIFPKSMITIEGEDRIEWTYSPYPQKGQDE